MQMQDLFWGRKSEGFGLWGLARTRVPWSSFSRGPDPSATPISDTPVISRRVWFNPVITLKPPALLTAAAAAAAVEPLRFKLVDYSQ